VVQLCVVFEGKEESGGVRRGGKGGASGMDRSAMVQGGEEENAGRDGGRRCPEWWASLVRGKKPGQQTVGRERKAKPYEKRKKLEPLSCQEKKERDGSPTSGR